MGRPTGRNDHQADDQDGLQQRVQEGAADVSTTPVPAFLAQPPHPTPSSSRPYGPKESLNFELPNPNTTLNHPIVVDLDGTLTPTDTLAESIVRLVKSRPLDVLQLPLWLLKGRAALKAELAQRVPLPAATLPYCEPLLDYLRKEKSKGRTIALATAADTKVADSVADHLGLFDYVLGSRESINLKGTRKLEEILEKIGPAFSYAGDAAADIPIWTAARGAIIVGASPRVRDKVGQAATPIELEFATGRAGIGVWFRAMRVHQWLKNLLVFVPLFTSFSFLQSAPVVNACLAFLSFSLAASGTYLINDLSDLDADRAHPSKRNRPIASGEISILAAGAISIALVAGGLMMAFFVGPAFLHILGIYVVVTSAYSWFLKRVVMLDVLTLAALYTFRILGGSFAIDVETSVWLLAFSAFIFLSLALIKRCSELVAIRSRGGEATEGRDYRLGDLDVLWPMGTGAGLCSAVVFGLFVSSEQASHRYSTPESMWLLAFVLIYWLARLWIKTARGEMDDDPLVFTIKDRTSRISIIVMVASAIWARFVVIG